eukprot:scaffold230_cov353-Prasinococcus_capsulatus_cf.AAC.1
MSISLRLLSHLQRPIKHDGASDAMGRASPTPPNAAGCVDSCKECPAVRRLATTSTTTGPVAAGTAFAQESANRHAAAARWLPGAGCVLDHWDGTAEDCPVEDAAAVLGARCKVRVGRSHEPAQHAQVAAARRPVARRAPLLVARVHIHLALPHKGPLTGVTSASQAGKQASCRASAGGAHNATVPDPAAHPQA